MRLWSLHPHYLDPQGLVALWREALLAQAVVLGKTRGYRQHPQLKRFLESPSPRQAVAAYLRAIHAEATRRGYSFDEMKIGRGGRVDLLAVSRGQLAHEWQHLRRKLESRSPAWLAAWQDVPEPAPHPLFRVVAGGIAEWEVVAGAKKE